MNRHFDRPSVGSRNHAVLIPAEKRPDALFGIPQYCLFPGTRRFAAALFAGMVMVVFAKAASADSTQTTSPMLAVLKQFENAPAKGLEEADMPVRKPLGNLPVTNWPGKGLAQHPFLFYGEGSNVLYVVNHGKVVWTYALPKGGEIDDAWMLSNGHIICTKMTDCYEVTPQKKIVWSYHCVGDTQIHALQPIGLDQVMIVENGRPPHLYILNKKDNSKVVSHELDAGNGWVHGQFRNSRITAQGTYLMAYLSKARVAEYDKTWKQIAEFHSPLPWAAVRLKNGNTLITGDPNGFVHEVDPKGEIVWAIEPETLPGIILHDVQTASRLANGDTLICNRGDNGPRTNTSVKTSPTPGPASAPQPPGVQAVEVTPDKKIVWVLQDYRDLPSCTGIQLLDEPGTPETPGDLQR